MGAHSNTENVSFTTTTTTGGSGKAKDFKVDRWFVKALSHSPSLSFSPSSVGVLCVLPERRPGKQIGMDWVGAPV